MKKLPKISFKQTFIRMLMRLTRVGEEYYLLPPKHFIFQIKIYKWLQKRMWEEGRRLRRIHGETAYRKRKYFFI